MIDEEIIFLYLSTDKKAENWKKVSKSKSENTLHFRIADGQRQAVQKLFKISSIPYFVLLDKEHKIAAPKAKWPRESKLKTDILNLLIP